MSPGEDEHYELYGLGIRSEFPFRSVPRAVGNTSIWIRCGPTDSVARASEASIRSPDASGWFSYGALDDGTLYLRWRNLFDFVVSADGRVITLGLGSSASSESLESYLISQVLSCALIRLGMEPIHATVLMTPVGAVGFLGDSGFGKSTLAATFIADGDQLVTDDLMVTSRTLGGHFVYPGPERLKLYPADSRRILGLDGDAPINDLTSKRIVRLRPDQAVSQPVELRALYALITPAQGSHRKRITIRKLDRRRAFIELTKGAFNSIIIGPERLEVQFEVASGLAADVPVRSLSYPTGYATLHEVRKAVLRDLSG